MNAKNPREVVPIEPGSFFSATIVAEVETDDTDGLREVLKKWDVAGKGQLLAQAEGGNTRISVANEHIDWPRARQLFEPGKPLDQIFFPVGKTMDRAEVMPLELPRRREWGHGRFIGLD